MTKLVQAVVNLHTIRRSRICLAVVAAMLLLAAQAQAELTVTPITWDVVGLDHNRPLTTGPQWFPVGARVCSDVATTGVEVDFVFPDSLGSSHPYINARPGSKVNLYFDEIGAGQCVDAYFEVEVTRDALAFGNSREYTIKASDFGGTASTPAGRQIYIQELISQNRNTTETIRYCDPLAGGDCDAGPEGTGWVTLGLGGSMNLAVGNRYFIELTSSTATGYEQLSSFIALHNTIFQIMSVSTKYQTMTAPPERVPSPHSQLWADACLWDSDPASSNYNSCLDTGKVGGQVLTLYDVLIVSGGGASVPLEALHYDRSGGSFHYNSDHSQSPGFITEYDPTIAGFSKRFIPSTIAADERSTLRFNITNPNPITVSGYNFIDYLPGDMVVADPANTGSTCGGSITAVPGQKTVYFEDGLIDPNSSCAIMVDVTVPFDVSEEYPLSLLNVADLYVGDAEEPSDTAEATLTVDAEPPPPLECEYFINESIAEWMSFIDINNPNHPPTGPEYGVGVTTNAGFITGITDVHQSMWRVKRLADTGVTDKLNNAREGNQYFEFVVDTAGIEYASLSMTVSRQNDNAPDTVTLDYGPAGDFTYNAHTWPDISRAGTPVISVPDLVNLNPDGHTLFRFFVYNATGDNQNFNIHDITFTGTGAVDCSPIEIGDPPDPPVIAKQFNPATVRVNELSTLTFTLSNPNTVDRLSGVTFRDELPAGMTAVGGSFVNNCSLGSTWGTDGDDSMLLFADGYLAAAESCSLSVDVVSTAIGENFNISDPIDARETLAGNTASDTLTVLPPPALPSIFKSFDPNPLLNASGASTLTFRISNNDPVLGIASVAFTDVLPAVSGVQMVPVNAAIYGDNGNCGLGYVLTWDSVTNALSFEGGEIAAGNVCHVWLDVEVPGIDVSGGPMLFPNETSLVSHVFNGVTYYGNKAMDTLLVDEPIPGIAIRKQVGLTDDIEGAWYADMVVPPDIDLYYLIIVENIGEVSLSPLTVEDLMVDLSMCSWPGILSTESYDGDHIVSCIVGPVTSMEGVHPNTAEATGSFNERDYTDDSMAVYEGVSPTAVVMGRVEIAVVKVQDFLQGIGVPNLDSDGLLTILRTWNPTAAEQLEGADREVLLSALEDYLDPDGDGQLAALRWETLEERGTIGFYVERLDGSVWKRINAEILPGMISSPMGADYWLVDPGVRAGNRYQYRLIEIEARGTTREYGPFDLKVGNAAQ